MKRIQSTKQITPPEMLALAKALERAGYINTAVGRDHIDFYDKVEIRSLTDGIQRNVGSSGKGA